MHSRHMTRLISEVLLRQMKSASRWQILKGKSSVNFTSPLIFGVFSLFRVGENAEFSSLYGMLSWYIYDQYKMASQVQYRSQTTLSHYPKKGLCPFKSVQLPHLGPTSIHAHQAAIGGHAAVGNVTLSDKKSRNARCFLVESFASFVPFATARIAVLRHLL